MTLRWDEFIFIAILLCNFFTAVVYLLLGVLVIVPARELEREEDAEEETEELHDKNGAYVLRFVVMVLCPVIGPLFFAASYLYRVMRFQLDLNDVVFRKDRVRTQIRADENRERNIVPVEEAVVVNDRRSLRMALMNTIKGEMYKAELSSISLALNANDSEAAHYAASALSDILNEFRVKVHRLYMKMREEAAEQTACEKELIDFMDDILSQKVLSGLEQKRFTGMLEEAAESLYKKDPLEFTEQRYESVCMRLLEINDFDNTEKWCARLKVWYPDTLAAYACRLKLYFTTKNKEAFFRMLEELKRSDVVIDNEVLELIRVFN